MHARGYKTVSTHICSGAIVLSKLGVPPGCHTLDIIAVGLVTGLLDRLPSRGEYKKVICCDIYIRIGRKRADIVYMRTLVVNFGYWYSKIGEEKGIYVTVTVAGRRGNGF